MWGTQCHYTCHTEETTNTLWLRVTGMDHFNFLQLLTGLNNAKSFWSNDSPKPVDIILGYSVPENIDRLEGFQRKVTDVFKAQKGLIYGRKLPEIKMNIIWKLWPTQNELGGWCDNNVWGFWKVQSSFMERNSYAGHPRAKIVGWVEVSGKKWNRNDWLVELHPMRSYWNILNKLW